MSSNERQVARLISEIERGEGTDRLKELSRKPKHSRVIGITGPLGVGKSCLVHRLAKSLTDMGKSVGIILNDPASAGGGAFLGDRIRMQELCGRKVFIRSIASSKSGGVSRLTQDIVTILNAEGYDNILIESTGAGQSDTDISVLSDVVVVVLIPNLGDEIQALKSGIMEIGDVFVVNKADRDGAERTQREIESMLNIRGRDALVVRTSAVKGEGIGNLVAAIDAVPRREEKLRQRLEGMLRHEIEKKILQDAAMQKRIDRIGAEIKENRLDIYTAVEDIVKTVELKDES